MSGIDLDKARQDRLDRLHPPEFAPGQGDSDSWFDDTSIATPTMNQTTDSFSGLTGYSAGAQPTLGASLYPTSPLFPQQPQQSGTQIDATKVAIEAGKVSYNLIRDLVESFRDLSLRFVTYFGSSLLYVSIGYFIVGIVLILCRVRSLGFTLLGTGLLLDILGVPLLMFFHDSAKGITSLYKEDPETPSVSVPDTDYSSSYSDDDDYSSTYGDDDEDDDDYGFGDFEESFMEDEPYIEPAISIEDSLTSMDEGENLRGIYTRQYLYEMGTKVLSSITPDFDKYTEYYDDDDDDNFILWDARIYETSSLLGIKEEDIPVLNVLRVGKAKIVLECSRRTNFKAVALAEELANIYKRDLPKESRAGVYSYVDCYGGTCEIHIVTGIVLTVTLKDTLHTVKDWLLDTRNTIPVVMGVNYEGEILKVDLKDVESMLITGETRSGKSWLLKTLLWQMCLFNSPRDLSFYIFDPKDTASDFVNFCVPHVKIFKSSDEEIITELHNVVRKEGQRRKDLIGNAGCKNIWDFKKSYPEVDLPVIYVVIDELVTLASRMAKDTKTEFQNLLKELISQLPAYGIRAMLVPHVVKHDILDKTTSSLIPCRISVRGDAEKIEGVLGVKSNDYNFKLCNTGDMAVKINAISRDIFFMHGIILTDSNEMYDSLFDYIRCIWKRLEPEVYNDSYAYTFEKKKSMQDLLVKSNVSKSGDISPSIESSDFLGEDDISNEEDISLFDFK